jgi:hypothetical protein
MPLGDVPGGVEAEFQTMLYRSGASTTLEVMLRRVTTAELHSAVFDSVRNRKRRRGS